VEVAFFDTSALVKHYHLERGSSVVNELMETYIVAISELAIVEMTSALMRRHLSGELRRSNLEWALERFYSDLENYVVVPISSETISLATFLVIKHGLKTLDSLQLASALRIKAEARVFVTFDEKLKKAAEKEGFKVLP